MENLTKINTHFNPELSRFNLISWVRSLREGAKNDAKQQLFGVISAFEKRENADFMSIANSEITILRTASAYTNCIRLAHKLNIITKQEFLAVKQSILSSASQYDEVYQSAINKILSVYSEMNNLKV
jgi:hypothetical protein